MKLPKFLRKRYKIVDKKVTTIEHTTRIQAVQIICNDIDYIFSDGTGFGLGIYNGQPNKIHIRQFPSYPRNWDDSLLIAQFPSSASIINVIRENVDYPIITIVKEKVKI
jgi:hypothetical protein